MLLLHPIENPKHVYKCRTPQNLKHVYIYKCITPHQENQKQRSLRIITASPSGHAMQRSFLAAKQCPRIARTACDVFLSHRKVDTARTIVGLLYDNLRMMGVRTFLDTENMKAGDRLLDHIDKGIGECKVGVTVFSPTYCDSLFCLHELALLMESKKRVVPLFFDIKPSQLQVKPTTRFSLEQLQRFSSALEEAKLIRGISFDPLNGDWSELLRNASNAVVMNLFEVGTESHMPPP